MKEWDRPALKTLVGKPNLIGAEIGVDSGGNALNILKYLDITKLYLIDVWKGYSDNKNKELNGDGVIGDDLIAQKCFEHARNSLKDYNDKIVWIQDYSENAYKLIRDKELDFIYIDGNHRYEWVKRDIELYYSKVKIGGLVAGHDYKLQYKNDVIKAVHEFFEPLKKQIYVQIWDWWSYKE